MRHLDYAPNLQMDNEVNTFYQFIGQQYPRGIPKKEAPPCKPFGGYFDDFKRGKDHLALPSVYRHICVSPSWQYMYTYHFTRMHMHPLYYDGPKRPTGISGRDIQTQWSSIICVLYPTIGIIQYVCIPMI